MNGWQEIESRLKASAGLDPVITGVEVLSRAVEERMARVRLTEIGEYASLLCRSEQELQELVELVVVPETWFCRDCEPFKFLKSYISSEWLPASRSKVLRILSIPCATGEEPYSIAMALREAGLTAEEHRIVAADLSKRALALARHGIYGKHSFRGRGLAFCRKYFTMQDENFRLHDSVRNTVRFEHGNLLDPDFLSGMEPFHIVFCRNLLIYFAPEARARACTALSRLLAYPGLLFVGHAEMRLAAMDGMEEVNHARAFAFRLKTARAKPCAPSLEPALVRDQGRPASIPARRVPDAVPQPPCDPLKTALRAADHGNLAEAAGLCETYLARNGPCSRAYFILGLVRESAGFPEQAEELFNKAVYLDPANYEALIHLDLLLRQRDESAAFILRERARRVKALNTD